MGCCESNLSGSSKEISMANRQCSSSKYLQSSKNLSPLQVEEKIGEKDLTTRQPSIANLDCQSKHLMKTLNGNGEQSESSLPTKNQINTKPISEKSHKEPVFSVIQEQEQSEEEESIKDEMKEMSDLHHRRLEEEIHNDEDDEDEEDDEGDNREVEKGCGENEFFPQKKINPMSYVSDLSLGKKRSMNPNIHRRFGHPFGTNNSVSVSGSRGLSDSANMSRTSFFKPVGS